MACECSTRCVVFAPPGATVDDRLRSLPESRSWRLTAFQEPCTAMAELCLRERAQASRAAWGLQRAERLALLLVVPDRGADEALECELAGLASAVRRYLPGVAIWLSGEEGLSVIAAGETGDAAENARPPAREADEPAHDHGGVARRREADLHLAAAAEETPALSALEPDDDPAGIWDAEPAEITAEEIEMLLARDSGEAPAR